MMSRGSVLGQTMEAALEQVSFDHSIFLKMGDCFFCLETRTGEPVLTVDVAGNIAVLPFPGLIREFGLCGRDVEMLELLARGLKYVRGLKIGDPLPKEVLTGEASWDLSQRYLIIAKQRIFMQLVNWVTGVDAIITSPEELLQLANDPATRKKVSAAFGEAAESIGIGRDNKQQMIQYVEKLTKELAYIEAMRDIFSSIREIQGKIEGLRKVYVRERSIVQSLDHIRKLFLIAVNDFDARFSELDAQTGEIIAVLKNLENQVLYIREKRDDLYVRLMAWNQLIAEWKDIQVATSFKIVDVISRLYQFLAMRFMKTDEWVLMTQLQNKSANLEDLKKKKKVLVW